MPFDLGFAGFQFAWPWLAAALPLPWLLAATSPAGSGALRVPGRYWALDGMPARVASRVPRIAKPAIAVWLLLLLAAIRPQWIGPETRPVNGRELMIAFDVSASMATTDIRTADGRWLDRLAAARALAAEFVARRDGDRIGLIVFGDRAFLHTPLTFDLDAVRVALDGVDVGLAGRETALGDAIAVSVRGTREHGDSAKVLLLFSDGAQTAGQLDVPQALWLARREGVRIHTVGVGAEAMQNGTDAPAVQGSTPAAGLDEPTLRSIAEETGGVYRRAGDAEALAALLREIDAAEPVAPRVTRPAIELYAWPLGAAMLALALWVGLGQRIGGDARSAGLIPGTSVHAAGRGEVR